MKAQAILDALEKQRVVYRKPQDFERYIILSKTSIEVLLASLEDGQFKEIEKVTLWTPLLVLLPWVTPEVPIFTPVIIKHFHALLSFWVTIYAARKWAENPPSLGEAVRTLHTWAYYGNYRIYLADESKTLNLAAPWEVDMALMHEEYNYDN